MLEGVKPLVRDRAVVERRYVPEIEVQDPERQRDHRQGEEAKAVECLQRHDRLEHGAGEPQDDQERRDVRDQEMLDHVRKDELTAKVRERRDERNCDEADTREVGDDPPRGHRPSVPREVRRADAVGRTERGEARDLKRLEDAC